jgi:membrane associated rhomboid family serine protease
MNYPDMTIILVIITSAISILTFYQPDLLPKLQFNAFQIWHRKEWYRMISHGFIHADWMHLIINMLVLYSFGSAVESYFGQLETAGIIHFARLYYLVLYLGGIIVSSLWTLYKQKDNHNYNAVGASGGVSAVVFTTIFFAPLQKILFYMAIPVPGIIFGVLYLIYSQYMARRSSDNINHDAHFIGAVFGFIFPLFMDYHLMDHFLSQLSNF